MYQSTPLHLTTISQINACAPSSRLFSLKFPLSLAPSMRSLQYYNINYARGTTLQNLEDLQGCWSARSENKKKRYNVFPRIKNK